MGKFDHLAIQVRDVDASRDWYVKTLGLAVEFELAESGVVALKDDADFALFLNRVDGAPRTIGLGLWYKVADVTAFHRAAVSGGAVFDHGPKKALWGYSAQLSDPDGHRLYVWDEDSMAANG